MRGPPRGGSELVSIPVMNAPSLILDRLRGPGARDIAWNKRMQPSMAALESIPHPARNPISIHVADCIKVSNVVNYS